MSDFKISKDIIVSTLQKSGYLMEQEVATQLEALGFHVWTNWAFEDSDEGKSREIDIRAIKRVAYNQEKKLGAFVEILVECKNSKNPLVFIGRPKNETDNMHAPEEWVFPISNYEKRKKLSENSSSILSKSPFFHLGFEKIHYDFLKDIKAVQFCRIDHKGKNWTANHDGLYDRIFYPMAKALIARKKEVRPRHPSDLNFWLFVPMVVVSSDIFYVNSVGSDPMPEEEDYITFKREIRSENLNGIFSLEFICQKQLEKFVSDCLEPLISKMSVLTMNQADFVLKKSI